MANSGLKQATVAYRVSAINGDPIDINGVPISMSGKKQAIALKVGFENPNPSLYEVYRYFDEQINGEPTVTLDYESCPIGVESPWVLDGGTWGMGRRWYNNRFWQFL